LQQARMHLEQVIASYDPQQHRALAFVYGHDIGVAALSYQAWVLWILGYPDQGLKHCQEAVTLARALDHPYSLTYALAQGCLYHTLRREPQVVEKYGEEGLRLSMEARFPLGQAGATFGLGWVRAQRGEAEKGIAQIRQVQAGWRSMGTGVLVPFFLLTLAEAYGMGSQAGQGLALLEEALDLVEKTEERIWEAEVHRGKGELLQMSGRLSQAEASFRQAMEVARRQQGKSWELRAALSLSRLFQNDGRSAEARPLLSEIYGWFTEGFDTPDLKEARALLEEFQKEGGKEGRGVLR